MIPTKPGYYYWRRDIVFPWRFAVVRPSGEYGIEDPFHPDGPLLEMETSGDSGEFGPRIPAPDRLKAMEELARCDPMRTAIDGTGVLTCIVCGKETSARCGATSKMVDIWHHATCQWLRAQPPTEDAP